MVHVRNFPWALGLGLAIYGNLCIAGVFDPDCTVEKAAKSAAAKVTIGVGGRCTPAEAAKDTARDAAGIDKKGPLEKRRDDGPLDKIRDKD